MAFDLVGNFSRGLQTGQQLQQSRSMNRLRDLMTGGIPTEAAGRSEFVNRVAAEDPGMALDWSKHFAGMEATKLARDQAEAPYYLGALQSVRNQADYERARASLAQRGLDVSGMPELYDPATVNMVLQGYKYASGLKPTAVSAGTTLVDPLTREPVYTAPAKPATDTAAMKNAAALGLKPGTSEYNEFIRQSALRPSTQINLGPSGVDYGDAPKGTAWARNPDGSVATQPDPETGYERPVVVPIAGGEEEREREAAAKAEALKGESKRQKATIVDEEIDNIFDLMDEAVLPTTGALGSWVSNIGGTAAGDIGRSLDTIKANIGFDQLNRMRAESPTGGALGQVSENENRLLQSVLGSLDQSQSEEQFSRNLRRLKRYQRKIINEGMSDEEIDRAMATLNEGQPVTVRIPEGVTEEDIEFTMEKHNLSREEVLRRLNAP